MCFDGVYGGAAVQKLEIGEDRRFRSWPQRLIPRDVLGLNSSVLFRNIVV